jgi:hypothetical protein
MLKFAKLGKDDNKVLTHVKNLQQSFMMKLGIVLHLTCFSVFSNCPVL